MLQTFKLLFIYGFLLLYLSYDLQFINKTDRDYPCALLGDILINFVHYTTEEDAKACWYRRLSRINWDNIYIILYEREDTTREDLLSLRNIPCKILQPTYRTYPELISIFSEYLQRCFIMFIQIKFF